MPGSFVFSFFSDPNNSFVLDNSVTPQFGLNNPDDLQLLVPEPATLLLLGSGLAGLGTWARRKGSMAARKKLLNSRGSLSKRS